MSLITRRSSVGPALVSFPLLNMFSDLLSEPALAGGRPGRAHCPLMYPRTRRP